MFKLRKLAVSCIFVLLAIGLFLTCDDPNNPFSNNLGEKVVVEPPTIFDISPVSGAFLSGDDVKITGTAKAYIKVEKVEVYIYKDDENNQREIGWTTKNISLTGPIKQKTMTYKFNTFDHNSGNDGPIRLKFRVWDTTGTPVESVQLVYIIKNKPGNIKMTYPSDTDIANMQYDDTMNPTTELPKVPYAGEIRGQIFDRRGLRPGFPQIKLWPDGAEKDYPDRFEMKDGVLEPKDDDQQWGWATLFLSCDDMQKESMSRAIAGPGFYAKRSERRVVNYSTFGIRLAEYTIGPPEPGDDPELRRVVYRVGKPSDTDAGKENIDKHVPFESGKSFNFRIRTRDVEPVTDNGWIPDPNSNWVEGFYPAVGFGTPVVDDLKYRGFPVKIRVATSGEEPTVEINNDDKDDAELISRPNPYITDYTSLKIVNGGFRLRIFIYLKSGASFTTKLSYKKSGGGGSNPLGWDSIVPYEDKEGRNGTIFTYDYNTGNSPAKPSSLFEDFTGYYTLTVTLEIPGDAPRDYNFTLYMDGKGPKVSIRSVLGAADDKPPAAAVDAAYTVNGNIQAVVDSTDERGIMAFALSDPTNMGRKPYKDMSKPQNYNDSNVDNGRPMIKWIVEEATETQSAPPDGKVQAELNKYQANPSYANLNFFRNIEDTLTSLLTDLPSGWVNNELPDRDAKNDADKAPHFKLNTTNLTTSTGYYWLYVIAMDQVQNLGYTVKKIYVDQSTDNPKPDISPLFDKNAGNTPITSENNLNVDVAVNIGDNVRSKSGNWSGDYKDGKRNNVLRDEGIVLNFIDDDGISLDKGGVKIILTDLNTPPAAKSSYTFTDAEIKNIINSGGERDWSGTLSQEAMAKALGMLGTDGKLMTILKDGMYKIEFTVQDDETKKVALTPPQYPGDTPGDTPASNKPPSKTYYFAVSRDLPVITITEPANNALGSNQPQDIYGEVKSRFTIQSMWISFNPNVVAASPSNPTPTADLPINLSLYANAAYTNTSSPTPDADGYYTYYWIQKNVIFHPQNGSTPYFGLDKDGGVRNFTVEAYDRIGNLSTEKRTVLIDSSEPEITLVEFNYDRPADPQPSPAKDILYVYGKVSFTLSASAKNGLSETETDGVKMSGVKWWVLPASVSTPPSWDTPPTIYPPTPSAMTPSTWTGGGNFRLDQQIGGKYTGVVDTRYLTDKTEYKFYYMVRDKAGRTISSSVILKSNIDSLKIDSFTVDQTRDYPTIDEDTLSPQKGSVGSSNQIISGTVSDADRFDPKKTSNYVRIRFPKPAVTGKPAAAADWDAWIPITIPSVYTAKDGGIDPSGAILYRFDVTKYTGAAATNAKTYLSKDGIKYYQIEVTDEPDAGPDGRNYGKNPDEFMRGKPAYSYPSYDAVYLRHDKVSIVFPMDKANPLNPTPPDSYTFNVDNTKPVIYFNYYDPTVGHENFMKNADGNAAPRPTFSKWTQLKEALNNVPKNGKGNYVLENQLIDLTMSWNAEDKDGKNYSFTTTIISEDPDKQPPADGVYPWDLTGFITTDDTDLETVFNKARQGLQVITFEATDKAGQTGRVSWIFAKDTRGPSINFSTINRSIKRTPPPIPPAANFPAGWPPEVTEWNSAWDAGWKTIINNWPSEYAFKTAAEVNSALTEEDTKPPSTVIGDENTPGVIQGSFEDEYSALVPANTQTYFYYRFKDKNGKLQDISGLTGLAPGISVETLTPIGFTDPTASPNNRWIQKEVKKGKNDKEADWEIILNKANGFTGTDGENWLDIRVADTADNISEIYNVRFLLDSAPPLLGDYDTYVTPPAAPKPFENGEFKISKIGSTAQNLTFPLPEDRRVISAFVAAADKDGTGKMLSISGRVNDYNLNNLTITLGQDGYTTYTVTAFVEIDPLSTAPSSAVSPNSTGTGVVKADPDKVSVNGISNADGNRRLTLNGPFEAGTNTAYNTTTSTGTPEWEWTFDILQKDVYGLRNAAGIGKDSEFSTRRFIKVTASDKAQKKVDPVEWAFYLDTKKPVIEYTNLEKGRNGSSFESDVKLSALVSDDTKIKDVKYIIGRWNYTTKVWNWYSGSGWSPDQPAVTAWPSVFASDTSPARLTTMDFTINQAMLDAANAKTPNTFPANLFSTEGQYRIDLCVTDFSLGNGNEHKTTDGDNTEPPSTTGFSDDGYKPKTGEGNASARVFYVDKKDPTLKWASTIEDKTYFRNEDSGTDKGKAIFGFIAGDGNTLQNWTAVVRDKAGNIVETTTGTKWLWDVGTGKTSQAIDEPVTVASNLTVPATTPNHKISDTSIDEQYFEIKPFMTKDADKDGEALDKNVDPLPTYTITITVTDGAKRTSSITKTFTLDNTPPEFVKEKYNPLSYKYGNGTTVGVDSPVTGRSYSYDAVTGKLNIRGNTTDNSNQIKSISYYVVNSADSATWTNFPTPAGIAANKWLSGKDAEILTNGATLIQLDEGTLFAWSILAPRTSLFLTGDATAQAYVQRTKTNGLPITGGTTPVTDGKYYDVNTSTWATSQETVPRLTFPDLNNPNTDVIDNPKRIYGGDAVGMITIYVRAEDAAGNVAYDAIKYWIWPEGDRPIITAINTPDSSKPDIERLLNGTIRLSGMAKDNERVKFVWFRVLDPDGVPYKNLKIPNWKYEEGTVPIGGNWDEAAGNQDPGVAGSTIGSRRDDDPGPTPGLPIGDGWYMANGGNARDVSWWAYINTNGELDPQNNEERRKFTVEVRAQDVTYDEKNDRWMPYANGYMGMASAMTTVSRTDAWVVANAPVFDKQRIAAAASDTITDWEIKEANGTFTYSMDNVSLNKRSSYKVTVTHNIGLSSIRWSPTQWFKDKTIAADIGAFRADPGIDSFNLLAKNPFGYTAYVPGEYVWLKTDGTGYGVGDKTAAFGALTGGTAVMAMHVVPKPGTEAKDPVTGAIYKDPVTNATLYYKEYDVFVDMRADLLLEKMLDPLTGDPDYGNGTPARAGQTKNSVRYPLYMSASDISKADPITSRGDVLLPIDNLKPYGMYTLNRKPAGTAVTIGGEAGDDGPVNGIARVVVWFQRGASGVSWHERHPTPETTLLAGTFKSYTANSGPAWWDAIGVAGGGVLPATGVDKPAIPAVNASGAANGDGASAIVIDTNSPSTGVERWGHKLPMGFADGGIGKLWYVEINSYGLESGPIDLHYVVIDKAGNAKYYKERLIIMNDVAVIDRVKLATDIRHNTSLQTANRSVLAGGKINDKAAALTPADWPVLKDIRSNVPLGGDANDINDDVKKGISDWVSASALGANKVIDFNVRNRVFALRVETTKPPKDKTRTFRVEYISGATLLTNTQLLNIEAGRMYVINDRGTARWGTFGAEGEDWQRGYVFIASVNGKDLDDVAKANIGVGSAWQLTTSMTLNAPASATAPDSTLAATAQSAEFQYSSPTPSPFDTIVDTNGPNDIAFPPTGTWGTWTNANWSLFILRVFDGPETDLFGDFTILRVRVNNDDKTAPFAQLYDLNPKTEGQERTNIAGDSQTVEESRSVSPMFIGEGTGSNRTKGGLWNIASKLGDIDKPGHIEPRRTGSGASAAHPSLTSAQMGGAATAADASITKPFVNTAGLFEKDTVSGKVVLRGYAEDDQRVQSVSLVIGSQTINILEYHNNSAENTSTAAVPPIGRGTAGDSATFTSPKTGLLKVPTAQNGKVYFSDSIDLYRHQVEWAYIWDTETIPSATTVVGNDIKVSVVAYPRNGVFGTAPKTTGSVEIPAPGSPHVSTPNPGNAFEATRPNTSPFNKDFPVGLNKYSSITVNIRPYIMGFLRNTSLFSHNTRSRQGRYMFYRGETAVVKGFNLGTGNISLNNTSITTANVGTPGDFGIETDITKLPVDTRNNHYRQFPVGNGITTGSGLVTYTYSTRDAVNTGGERAKTTTANPATVRPTYIQPWNIEYSPGIDGSTLWDDFTQIHIWQSNDNTSGGDNGRFPKGTDNMEVFDPSMSIDPATGTLWTSHNEGGGGNGSNSGSTKIGNNINGTNSAANSLAVASFIDPIINSDIFISARPSGSTGNNLAYTVWTAYSIIGKPGGGTSWGSFGGVWISGPQGGDANLTNKLSGSLTANNGFLNQNDTASRSMYMAESTYYNSQANPPAAGPQLNQFKNPHIISYWDNSNEHIHVSYYDTKDKSVKYRYNRRNYAETINGTGAPKAWTNLDGDWDTEDNDALNAAGVFPTVAAGGRIVNSGRPRIDAGEYNSIALTSQGYPVVAYYDRTNQRIKLAISNNTAPIAASGWTIIDNVITNTAEFPNRQNLFIGTGEYVSMKIDTRPSSGTTTQNTVHIAAMNSSNKSLVYIKGTISGSTYTCTSVQVVDSVGSVGRWCSISLDTDGNPWISYQDESYQGSRDGIKLAYYNSGTYYKGSATYRVGEDVDINNVPVTGWEAMHVPTQFRVENARQGMENYPARNYTGNRNPQTKFWKGAVGYLGQDYFRAAYYVE